MKNWSVQDAKAHFSEVLERASQEGPQLVSKRGKETAVILGIEEYRRLAGGGSRKNIVDFFRESPLAGLDPALFERQRDPKREIDW